MRVLMVTGSYPPHQTCGVGDNTFALVENFKISGVNVEVFSSKCWRNIELLKIFRQITRLEYDLIHIQYPTIGYGYSLIPHLLSLLTPSIVTIHEVSQVNIFRRLSLLLFSIRSLTIVFTNKFERDYFIRYAPWVRNKTSVIPIGNAIPVVSISKPLIVTEIVYFGLIRPEKGLEDVLLLAKLLHESPLKIRLRIIGSLDHRMPGYYEKILLESHGLPVIWNIGLDDGAVGQALARAHIAYLPFPDGASERRSSLLACLANGVVTISTLGKFTTDELSNVIVPSNNPNEAFNLVNSLIMDNSLLDRLSMCSKAYVKNHSWDQIVNKYLSIYDKSIQAK